MINKANVKLDRCIEDARKGRQVEQAGTSVAYELSLYAHTIKEEYREDWFHPMNRDHWIAGFCEWLAAKQRKSAEVRASND